MTQIYVSLVFQSNVTYYRELKQRDWCPVYSNYLCSPVMLYYFQLKIIILR